MEKEPDLKAISFSAQSDEECIRPERPVSSAGALERARSDGELLQLFEV